MSEHKHGELWRVVGDKPVIVSKSGYTIRGLELYRARDCVNACAGMSDEELEKMGKHWRKQLGPFINKQAILKAQLDEAVGLLEELAELTEEAIDGKYNPDSFTTQPARIFLRKHKESK